MPKARPFAPIDWNIAYYHCFSRIIEGRRILGAGECHMLLKLIREYEGFCGVQVVTYCIMTNHFHILIAVPRRPDPLPPADELLRKFDALSGKSPALFHRQAVHLCRSRGDVEGEIEWCKSAARRMWNISEFVKAIKQRFTQAYNRLHDRKGTLWEGRFGSVLVEGEGRALSAMAAYIDLNPVRAGLVKDPKDYPWSGYANAVAGDPAAISGMQRLAGILHPLASNNRDVALAEYRLHLYRQADPSKESLGPDGRTLRATIVSEEIKTVIAQRGSIPIVEYVHCRVRYFTAGVYLGSRAWVEDLFQRHRRNFSRRRSSGARRIAFLMGPPLYTARALRKNVVTIDSS